MEAFTGVEFKSLRSDDGDVTIIAAGGITLFVIVLVWRFSPVAPVSPTTAGTVTVRATILGLDRTPINDGTKVWSPVGGEKKT